MKSDIQDKLAKFLNQRKGVFEECDVVYLMVELRKLLDKERENDINNNNSLVRFHADWVIHTSKDNITLSIKKIMKNIESLIDTYPKNGDITFIFMPEFRDELLSFLKKYNLPFNFCEKNNIWKDFIRVLTNILADQPINNPTDSIKEFRYIEMNNEGIMVNIDFRGKKAGQSITLGFGL